MDTLDVINAMLATLGELPLNELDARHPYVASGLRILKQKSRTVQLNAGAGYWFNKLTSYTLRPDLEGRVAVPEDLIQFSAEYPDSYGVVDGYLWDNINDTDVIGKPVEVSAIRELAFDNLPVAAQDYIAASAIHTFTRDYDGDMTKVQDIINEGVQARILLRMQNTREQRANTLRNPQVQSAIGGFTRGRTIKYF